MTATVVNLTSVHVNLSVANNICGVTNSVRLAPMIIGNSRSVNLGNHGLVPLIAAVLSLVVVVSVGWP